MSSDSLDPVLQLARQLRFLHEMAGAPSSDELRDRIALRSKSNKTMGRSTINDKLNGRSAPTIEQLLHIHAACLEYADEHGHPIAGDLRQESRWRQLWFDMRQLRAERLRSAKGGPPGDGHGERSGEGQELPTTAERFPNGAPDTVAAGPTTSTVQPTDIPPPRPAAALFRTPPPVPPPVARPFPLPLVPGIVRYQEIEADLRLLGCRHAADLLLPDETTSFLILDGVWIVAEPDGPQRVDAKFLRSLRVGAAGRHPYASVVSRVLRTLETVAAEGPAGLRRLLLYQLTHLLRSVPSSDMIATARKLGVHLSEAAGLALSVSAADLATDRRAAERLTEVWRSGGVRECADLLRRLPSGADSLVDDIARETRTRTATADIHLAVGHEAEQRGDPEGAYQIFSAALQQAPDDRAALAGVVRTADAAAAALLSVRMHPAGTELAWMPGAPPEAVTDGCYRVVRVALPPDPDNASCDMVICTPRTSCFDELPPFGSEVRYVVVPFVPGGTLGTLAVSPTVRHAPGPLGSAFHVGSGSVSVTWRLHRKASYARVVRRLDREPADLSDGSAVPCTATGFLDDSLPTGTYHYLAACWYDDVTAGDATASGTWSESVRWTGTVELWPTPVVGLQVSAHRAESTVRFSWEHPERGETTLRVWPEPAPEPGTEIAPAVLAHAPLVSWPNVRSGETPTGAFVDLAPPSGTLARVVAVSTLDGRSVAGASALLHVPGPLGDMAVRRVSRGELVVSFAWPESALSVEIEWEQDRWVRRARLEVGADPVIRQCLSVAEGECDVVVRAIGAADADLAICPEQRFHVTDFRDGEPMSYPPTIDGSGAAVMTGTVQPEAGRPEEGESA